MVNINADMIVLAREYRNLTQQKLAQRLFVSQAKIAKLEGGIQTDVSDIVIDQLSNALDFPKEFFTQKEDVIGFGSSAYFYRKKTKITASQRKHIHASINLLRIQLKKMLTSVDIEAKRKLPRVDIEEFGGSAKQVAQALRASWQLPDGPIKNLTRIIESAGVIIVPVDFKTRYMDGTSLRLNEMPPLIFINSDQPGDRWRFTLAHELAHLILHDVPHEQMENEADEFAAELLMPARELAPQFSALGQIRLVDLSNLKHYWKCSIAALLMRARDLGYLSDNQNRYLWSVLSKHGWRKNEPNPIEVESVSTYPKILDYFKNGLDFRQEDFAKMFKVRLLDLHELYASLYPRKRQGPNLQIVV